MDCHDSSDEEDCHIVVLNTGYRNLVVPTGPSGTLNLTLTILVRNVNMITSILRVTSWLDRVC